MDIANLVTSILQAVLAAIGLVQNYYIFNHINREYKPKASDDESTQSSDYESYSHERGHIQSAILAQARTRTDSHGDIGARRTPDYDTLPRYERPLRSMSRQTTFTQAQAQAQAQAQGQSWPVSSCVASDAHEGYDPKPAGQSRIFDQPDSQRDDGYGAQSICSPSKALVHGSQQPGGMADAEFEDYVQAR